MAFGMARHWNTLHRPLAFGPLRRSTLQLCELANSFTILISLPLEAVCWLLIRPYYQDELELCLLDLCLLFLIFRLRSLRSLRSDLLELLLRCFFLLFFLLGFSSDRLRLLRSTDRLRSLDLLRLRLSSRSIYIPMYLCFICSSWRYVQFFHKRSMHHCEWSHLEAVLSRLVPCACGRCPAVQP